MNYTSGTTSVLVNQGSGTFASQVAYAVGPYTGGVAAADALGMEADIVTANAGSNTVRVLVNQGGHISWRWSPCRGH